MIGGTWPAALEARDQTMCTCGHKNVSHGYGTGRTAGTGMGACGFCPCTTFTRQEVNKVSNPEICPSCNAIIRPTGECRCSD